MPFTLADAAQLTQSMLVRGIIEVLITESSVLRYLPFVGVSGSSVQYTPELTLPTAPFHAPLDNWAEDAGDLAAIVTESLTIIGGDADVDQFVQQTYSNKNDIKALTIEYKAKAIAYAFNNAFFHGDSAGGSNQFDGLKKRAGAVNTALAYSSTVRAASNGANGAVLDLDTMDKFVDSVKPGKPDVLFMSKRSRRKLSSLKRASGSGVLETTADSFGRRVTTYDGIPIEIDENIPDTETQGGTTTCSSIYAVKFGFRNGVCGLQNGGIQATPIGNLETKDAWRTRIKWYVGMAVFVPWAYARLAGVQ